MREFTRYFTGTVAGGLAVVALLGLGSPDRPACVDTHHMCAVSTAQLDVSQINDLRP